MSSASPTCWGILSVRDKDLDKSENRQHTTHCGVLNPQWEYNALFVSFHKLTYEAVSMQAELSFISDEMKDMTHTNKESKSSARTNPFLSIADNRPADSPC